jgi:hypothetical protein
VWGRHAAQDISEAQHHHISGANGCSAKNEHTLWRFNSLTVTAPSTVAYDRWRDGFGRLNTTKGCWLVRVGCDIVGRFLSAVKIMQEP